MRFYVEIDSENEAVQTTDDCAWIISGVANKLHQGIIEANIKDDNGNTIGRFSLK